MTGFTGPGSFGGTPPGRPGPGYGPRPGGASGPFGSQGAYGPPRYPAGPAQPGPSQPHPGAAQPYGPTQQVLYGHGPGQYSPGPPPPRRGRGGLWFGLGIGAGLVVMAVTLVFVLSGGGDDESPSQNNAAQSKATQRSSAQDSTVRSDDDSYQEAFVQEFIVNSSTFAPGDMSRYEQAVDTYCDDSPDKSDARRGLTVLAELQVSSRTNGTPSVEVVSAESTGDRIPVQYSVNVTTTTAATSKSGTLTGTVYVRPGTDRCVIEVVEDESGSGPTQTF